MRDQAMTRGTQPLSERPARRGCARILAMCLFVGAMLAGGTLAAQQVLMAPELDLTFEELQVDGQPRDVQVAYKLAPNDWQWAQDFGLDLWLGIYQPGSNGQWELQKVEAVGSASGTVGFEDGLGAGAKQVGVCVIASSEGGKLAPGMGYVCPKPLVVEVTGAKLDWQKKDTAVALRFERQVDQQPWYTAERGFEGAADAQGGVDTEGDFVVYRAPSPPETVGGARDVSRRYQTDRPGYIDRDYRRPSAPGYPAQGMVIYTPGYLPGLYFDRDRFDFDRFRQRRLQARRFFGPLDIFDSKFDQDMFSTHPEDVFGGSRLPPGYFGRDAFGRGLRRGFDVPRHRRLGPGFHGLGTPFE